jgi:hypothetical protein
VANDELQHLRQSLDRDLAAAGHPRITPEALPDLVSSPQ